MLRDPAIDPKFRREIAENGDPLLVSKSTRNNRCDRLKDVLLGVGVKNQQTTTPIALDAVSLEPHLELVRWYFAGVHFRRHLLLGGI